MVRRVIWTSKADAIFAEILGFYSKRHKATSYSNTLNNEVYAITKLLVKYPYLGLKTDYTNLRVIIHGHFKIFYEVKLLEIIIHLIWDTRQNPKRLPLS